MKFQIRSKFVGILVIASLLPSAIALLSFYWFGTEYYRRSQGVICQTAASQLALSVSHSLRQEINLLDQWIEFTKFGSRVPAIAKQTAPQVPAEALDAAWPNLPDDSPEVSARITNDLANQLRAFQKRNPRFAEILVTDEQGLLIAATNKTTDYVQNDEKWWQRGIALKPGAAYVEGLAFDQSSNSHSIEITVPLFAENSDKPVGVLKGVIDVMPFLQKIPPVIGTIRTVHEVVLSSGEILSRLGDPKLLPFKEKVPAGLPEHLQSVQPGWDYEKVGSNGAVIIGYAPIGIKGTAVGDLQIEGLRPLWAIAYRKDSDAMAPIKERIKTISLLGLGLVLGFVLLGYQIASQKIIAPINSLRRAVQAISHTVRMRESDPQTELAAKRNSSHLLKAVNAIHTRDEIQVLANEFAFMGKQILSYHEKLESEIAAKTGEIRRDLEFARQFQANLMPRKYPEVPSSQLQQPALGLNFHHTYTPASTMGGDFFNVLKLSDSQAGVFIADVMGHGARSALVTAIIATLLQENRSKDPAEALSALNTNFHRLVHNTGEILFVTAFYLVLDTARMTASYASAGHPSPFLLDRTAGKVLELTPNLKKNPALGLFETHSYESFTRTIRENDLFLLFTDGIFECDNAKEEQLGRDGLRKMVEAHQSAELHLLIKEILKSVQAFTGNREPEDDVCLVGVEVSKRNPSA